MTNHWHVRDLQKAIRFLQTEPEGKFAKDYIGYLRSMKPEFKAMSHQELVDRAVKALNEQLDRLDVVN